MIDWSKAYKAEDRLKDAKEDVRSRFLGWANSITRSLTGAVPDGEKHSWSSKETEARNYLAGVIAAPNGLYIESAIRGVTIDELANRIVTKADAYRAAVYLLAGIRGKMEEELGDAKTEEEVVAAFDRAVDFWDKTWQS